MLYLMAMASKDSAAKAIVDKVEKFLSVATCPYIPLDEYMPTNEDDLKIKLDAMMNSGYNSLYGTGATPQQAFNLMCSADWIADNDERAALE